MPHHHTHRATHLANQTCNLPLADVHRPRLCQLEGQVACGLHHGTDALLINTQLGGLSQGVADGQFDLRVCVRVCEGVGGGGVLKGGRHCSQALCLLSPVSEPNCKGGGDTLVCSRIKCVSE
jgi:hypothetical protein